MMKIESYVSRQRIDKADLFRKAKPILSKLDIELTERCNNNCIHCCINLPVNDLEAKQRELSTEKLKKIIKEALSLDCLSVRFTGGEPLLREDFAELYVFARKLGLRVKILTNATLITPHLTELFNRIRPLEKIEVTVYGMRKNSYEAVTRVPGSFEPFRQGIELLLEKKVPFVVRGVLLPQNKDEINEFENWAATIPWMNKPPSYSMFFDLRCRRENEAKNELIKGLRLTHQAGLKIVTRRKNEYIRGMKDFCSKFIGSPKNELFPCGAGYGGCLDAYGYFQPCMMLRHLDYVYDLSQGSLKDALINFFPKLRKIKASNPEYLRRCAKCFLKGLCGQCPAKSWMEHGTLDTPVEHLCDFAHLQARFLGLVGESERAWEVKEYPRRIDQFVKAK